MMFPGQSKKGCITVSVLLAICFIIPMSAKTNADCVTVGIY